MPFDAEEDRYKKHLIERLVLGFTCRKYNLLYEGKWKFSFHKINNDFQVHAINEVKLWEGYPVSNMKLMVKTITLSSPIGSLEQMHFWMAGVVNMADYIKEEGLDYPVIAIA
jgi:hypothetical protein